MVRRFDKAGPMVDLHPNSGTFLVLGIVQAAAHIVESSQENGLPPND